LSASKRGKGLAVLSTNVDDGPGMGLQNMGAHAVTADLGDGFRRDGAEVQGDSAIAGAHRPCDATGADASAFQGKGQEILCRLLRIHATWNEAQKPAAIVDQTTLGLARPDVHTEKGSIGAQTKGRASARTRINLLNGHAHSGRSGRRLCRGVRHE
jgi:hypothetical protein